MRCFIVIFFNFYKFLKLELLLTRRFLIDNESDMIYMTCLFFILLKLSIYLALFKPNTQLN